MKEVEALNNKHMGEVESLKLKHKQLIDKMTSENQAVLKSQEQAFASSA